MADTKKLGSLTDEEQLELARQLYDLVLTPNKAATLAGVTRQTIYAWAAEGKITPISTASGLRIWEPSLKQFAAGQQATGMTSLVNQRPKK